MKQRSTLENDLTMIIELLSEMVENKHLSRRQLEKIMKSYFTQDVEPVAGSAPRKHIVNNIMNYSRSLEVYKKDPQAPFSAIIN
ncbi:MAG: hypothetical protein ACK4VN_14205 [Bacteroidales bacterium]